MTENLYLILHKVRGEPAFDVAQRIEHSFADHVDANEPVRDHVWIIPTSGHRAYPVWTHPLYELVYAPTGMCLGMTAMPCDLSNVPDHYAASEPRAVPAVRRVPASRIEDFTV